MRSKFGYFVVVFAGCLLMFGNGLAIGHETQKPKSQTPKRRSHPSFVQVEDVEKLPRVLLIGDSISMGYTQPVRKLLSGKANVHRIPMNGGPTPRGVENLEKWLGDKQWDVIHFNFGLHDVRCVNKEGKVDKKNGSNVVPIDEYVRNLTRIVNRLRETDAKLIWCTTTPIPQGAKGRRKGDAVIYNKVAAGVMQRNLGEDRIVNDLYQLAFPQLDKIQRKADVHFTPDGSKVLAQQVADIIERHLPSDKPTSTQMATGVVFHDKNNNGRFDEGDKPMPGIRVSNSREIVKTDQQGRYRLGVDDDTILFVIKPRGWRTPLSKNMLPRFYYIHKPNGSPPSRFAGVAPTGPLPDSVDFPLYPQDEPDQFKVVFFGDPQPSNQKEVDYVAHDVVEELVGTDASLGVTLGDIMFDNLDLFESQNRAIALLGIPWYNVIGNHDINREARRDKLSDETFERVFGPSYYSFDHGAVHFLVLDNVEWVEKQKGHSSYQGGIGKEQMAFVRRDLEMIPEDQLVVLMMHIPLQSVRDRSELYRLIEKRPFCMSISGHAHFHEHRFVTKRDGWRGPKPHHHLVNVTVCGSWWAGAEDERGIPHAIMSKGAPNGYSTISFDGHNYKTRFKAAGRPEDYQMNVYAPEMVKSKDSGKTILRANVFNGSEKSVVEFRLGKSGEWSPMTRTPQEDPAVARIHKIEKAIHNRLVKAGADRRKLPQVSKAPGWSQHMWQANLPANMSEGTHLIMVRSTDMHGQVDTGVRVIRVEK